MFPPRASPTNWGPILDSHGFTHFLLSLWKTWIATNTKTNKQTKFKKGARDVPSPSVPTQLGPILGSHAPSPKMHFKAKPGRRWWRWLQRPWWWNLLRVFRFKTVDTPLPYCVGALNDWSCSQSLWNLQISAQLCWSTYHSKQINSVM